MPFALIQKNKSMPCNGAAALRMEGVETFQRQSCSHLVTSRKLVLKAGQGMPQVLALAVDG